MIPIIIVNLQKPEDNTYRYQNRKLNRRTAVYKLKELCLYKKKTEKSNTLPQSKL